VNDTGNRLRKFGMEMMWSIVRIAVAAYIGLCLLVFFIQPRYVYYPGRTIDDTPERIGLSFENVSLRTQDGETITGWYVPANSTNKTGPARTALICHGNGGDIGDRVDTVKTFHNMGLSVLMFDYRGYGTSTGKPGEQGTYFDALAAWNYLKAEKKTDPKDIIVFGQSLGGAVATWLSEQANPGMLILESTLTSAPDMAAKIFPFLPVRLFCRFKYDSLQRLGKIHCPVLIAHSRDDDTVPFEQGRRLFAAANEPKQFVEMTGTHNECGIDFDGNFRRTAVEFIKKHSGSEPAEAQTGEKQ